MRTKWLALAAFLVAVASACGNDDITNVFTTPASFMFGARYDTTRLSDNRTCAVATQIRADGDATNDSLVMTPGSSRRNWIVETMSIPDCAPHRSFRITSSDTNVVKIAWSDDSTQSIIVARNPGLSWVSGTDRRQSTHYVQGPVVVRATNGGTGGSPTVTITTTGQTLCTNTSGNHTLTMQAATTNPSGSPVTWSASNLVGVAIDATTGVITANNNTVGTLTVFATANGVSDTTTVTISNSCSSNTCQVTGLTATASDSSLTVGQTAQITPNQSTNGVAGCSSPTYSSSNNSVLTVNANGLVTAVSAGTAIVTVSSGSFQRSITFTVTSSGSGNTIDYTPRGGTLSVGASQTLTSLCTANGITVTCAGPPFWFSNDPTIAAVRGNSTVVVNGFTWFVGTTAMLTCMKAGTTHITVQQAVSDNTVSQGYDWTCR